MERNDIPFHRWTCNRTEDELPQTHLEHMLALLLIEKNGAGSTSSIGEEYVPIRRISPKRQNALILEDNLQLKTTFLPKN